MFPLSAAQRRLWFLDQLEGPSGTYNVPVAVRLCGQVHPEALRLALADVVTRHETLRTVFPTKEGLPYQDILDERAGEVRLPFIRVGEEELQATVARLATMPFDLAAETPLRAYLLSISAQVHVLLVVIHHIATDAVSHGPFFRDLAVAYRARTENATPGWAPLPVQYVDYAIWQQELLGDEADPESLAFRQVAFWRETLAGVPEDVVIPPDHSRPAVPSRKGAVHAMSCSAEVHAGLLRLARQTGTTLFMVAKAATAVLLSRSGAGHDIPIGSLVAGRPEEALEDLVGFFVNTLVLRTDTSGNPTFRELLGRVRETVLAAWSHQDLPFERLVEVLNPQRSAARNPLFQVMLTVDPSTPVPPQLEGLSTVVEPADTATAKFDLSFRFTERRDAAGLPDGLDITVQYASELYDPDTIRSAAAALARLLEAVIADVDLPVECLELLAPEERQQILTEWNDTAREVPEQTLPELFQRQVSATPDAVALMSDGVTLSYQELNARANRLARHLIGRGIGPESLVALALPRTVDLVTAMVAVAKAGGAYLPVDPGYPAERIAYVLGDAGSACLITTGAVAKVPADGVPVLLLDEEDTRRRLARERADDPAQHDRLSPLTSAHPAYVIYTSGSTGRPKGVVISHSSLVNFLTAMAEHVTLDADDRLLAVTTFAFDIAALEIFLPLVSGACVVLADEGSVQDPAALAELIRSAGVSVLQGTPALWQGLLAAEPDTVRALRKLIGGEALPAVLAERLVEAGAELTNLYGPTEATVWSTAARITPGITPVIGRPLANTQVYVLDEGLRPTPVGVAGELYITGDGLARGYLNRPGLTAERFVADPFGGTGSRMYRTGDVVRWNRKGELVFLGRADQQVKLRGFRIELGEVENALASYPSVARAVVVLHDEEHLVGYVVPTTDAEIDGLLAAVSDHVRERLPEYMVPSAIQMLAELPLTDNGKVNRRALPDPEFRSEISGRSPRTPQEQVLCALFAEVLGLDQVSIDDGFFDLGGHSLLATRLASRVHSVLGVELPLRTLFETPTVAGLSGRLAGGRLARTPLEKRTRPDRMPASFAQRRLLFLSELDGGVAYNIPIAMRLSGSVDVGALEDSLADVADRHEALRTIFPAVNGEHWQQMTQGPRARPALRVVPCDEDALELELVAAAEQPFQLSRDLPLRAWLFVLGPEVSVLMLVVHHIVCDGWSLELLLRDLAQAYAARWRGASPPWPELEVQYADYTLWQRELLGDENDPASPVGQQLTYWRKALAGLPAQLRLPFDHPRTPDAGLRAGVVEFTLRPELAAGLATLTRAFGSTLFMALQAAVSVTLAKLGAGTDIPLGTATSGRTDAALDALVGFFVNTLVLRTDLKGNPTFAELLGRIRETNLAALANQDVPFESLVEALNPERVPGVNPLFQVSVSMQAGQVTDLVLQGLDITRQEVGPGLAAFDLSFVFADERVHALTGSIRYRADLFERSTVTKIAARLLRVLEQVVANPTVRIGQIEILSEEERHRVLEVWNDTVREAPEGTLPELLAAQVARTPQATAVRFMDTELSYADLDGRATDLAGQLLAHGVGPEQLVALAIPRSDQMIVALLAVLKANAAYLPVDPGYPAERVAFMLEDAAPACLICTSVTAEAFASSDVPIIVLDAESSSPPSAEVVPAVLPDNPAYVIYTSGSTGQPKGVVISHRGIPSLVASQTARLGLNGHARVLQFASLSFDASVWEICMALLSGGSLVIMPETNEAAGKALADFIRANEITHATLPPAVLVGTDFSEDVASVTLVTAGEACSPAVVEATRHFGRVINAYGPTEATICATTHALEPAERVVPIGRPLTNTRAFVLDTTLAPVPAGVAGELYIAGPSLARGYLNRPGLTADRFVANPFGTPGERMYRTGDVASWSDDGELIFMGRVDDQVKVRGFRIELSEVESVLTEHPQVSQAAVIAHTGRDGDSRLVAYVVLTQDLDTRQLRRFVAERLPDFMVPATVVALEFLPLTPNGKVNRKALPAPQTASPDVRRSHDPRTEVLRHLFAQVLDVPSVEADESFFDLGGHSLLAVRAIKHIRARLGADISIRTLFESPTAAELATRLDDAPQDQFSHVIEIRRAVVTGPSVFCIHPIGGLSWCYSALLPYLDRERALYGVQVTESHGRFRPVSSLQELADRYTDLITSADPDGPYTIVGWSLGGVLAYEVASRIEASGGRVDQVIMLDSRPYDEPLSLDDAEDDFVNWVSGEVMGSAGDDTIIDDRQRRALIRAARTIAAVLGPPSSRGYNGRALVISALRSVENSGSPEPLWRPYLSAATHLVVNAEHRTMMTPGVLEQVGPVLREALSGRGVQAQE